MTENEYTIEELIDFMYAVMDDSDIETTPMINEVIQAIEEIQEYRAIGTVEECKADKVLADKMYKYFMDDAELLKEYKAIGTVEEIQQKDEVIATQRDIIEGVYKDYEKYLKIGTIEECRTAVERMKPKKPTDIVMAKDRKICVGRIGKCPCCGNIVAEDNFTCEDCFQVLDWSE